MGTPHCSRGDLCRSCQCREQCLCQEEVCSQNGQVQLHICPSHCNLCLTHAILRHNLKCLRPLLSCLFSAECFISEDSLIFPCFSVPWLICLLKQLVQQKQEEGTHQTFPWCAHCCLSGSSVDAMLSFGMCRLAGEHPGKKGRWKIATAAMVAIDGPSNRWG